MPSPSVSRINVSICTPVPVTPTKLSSAISAAIRLERLIVGLKAPWVCGINSTI